MKPVKFKESNVVFAKDQTEYLPLQAHRTKNGTVTSCWKLSFIEKVKILFTGRIYIQIMTFNQRLQPQLLSVDNPVKNTSSSIEFGKTSTFELINKQRKKK